MLSSSAVFRSRAVNKRPNHSTAGGLIQGGLPILHKGECVGAIGVSGVQSHEDEQVAQAGIDALG